MPATFLKQLQVTTACPTKLFMEFSFILKRVSYMITQGFPVYSCLITQSPRVVSSAFCHSVRHSPGPGTPHCNCGNRYTGRDTEQSAVADVHMRLQVMLMKHMRWSTRGDAHTMTHTQWRTHNESGVAQPESNLEILTGTLSPFIIFPHPPSNVPNPSVLNAQVQSEFLGARDHQHRGSQQSSWQPIAQHLYTFLNPHTP